MAYEESKQHKIIDALEAIPAEERTPEMDSELARAYNNLADFQCLFKISQSPAQMEETLNLVFDEISFEMGFNGKSMS